MFVNDFDGRIPLQWFPHCFTPIEAIAKKSGISLIEFETFAKRSFTLMHQQGDISATTDCMAEHRDVKGTWLTPTEYGGIVSREIF